MSKPIHRLVFEVLQLFTTRSTTKIYTSSNIIINVLRYTYLPTSTFLPNQLQHISFLCLYIYQTSYGYVLFMHIPKTFAHEFKT